MRKISIIFGILLFLSILQAEDILSFKKESKKEEEFLNFSIKEWREILKKIDEGEIEEKEIIYEIPVEVEEKKEEKKKKPKKKEPERIEIKIAEEAALRVLGRKYIGIQYGFYKYLGPESERTLKGTPPGAIDGLDMKQELKIKIQGKVADRLHVNIDYDDTQDDLNRRKISVYYQGKKDEFIQEARFGDVSLSLPRTEFVGYTGSKGVSKQAFGIKLRAKYKNLSLTLIGSQSKGLSEVKRFKGETAFNKKTIPDTSYISHKYYKLYCSTTEVQLPIEKGSEKIYLDDRDSTTNEATTKQMEAGFSFFNSTETFKGDFDLLVPGVDYVMDYSEGIITFKRTISDNYVIAVDYKDSSGKYISEKYGRIQIIKDETDVNTIELKNRYSIGDTKIIRDPTGEKFVIKILDSAGNEEDENGVPYIDKVEYEIDYDLGIIEFKDERPFETYFGKKDVYDKANYGKGRLYYEIYVEYRTRKLSYTLGRINIVKDSEKVIVDGETLKRDIDYFIDYYTGYITFINEEKIKEDSEIVITYDYYPFFGARQDTLVGLRADFKGKRNFSLGSTIIYNFSPQTQDIPDVNETPKSVLIMEADSKFSFGPYRFFPFRAGISGEIAKSIHNPNRAGKAIVDNMEGVKEVSSFSLDEDLWMPSSIEKSLRGELNLSNEDVPVKDIKGIEDEEERTQVLVLDYEASSSSEEVGIVYPISREGRDFSEKLYIEMWVYGDSSSSNLSFELGIIDEDINGNGEIDTEDKNHNGLLDEGEDTGIEIEDGVFYGKDNGKLDSEDLDRDGFLDSSSICFSTNVVINWSGWRKIVFPIEISDPVPWQTVKSARIRITGGRGLIKIASLGIVGNKWKVVGEGLEVDAKNNEDDPDYDSLLDEPEYQDLYSFSDNNLREQALVLRYLLSTSSSAYVEANYSRMDFSEHRRLNFFIHGENNGDVFFIRFGDSANNYYEYSSTVTWNGWRHISISLEDNDFDGFIDGFTSKKGNPSLNNISYIQIGVIKITSDTTEKEIWVNEIYLSNSKRKEGSALRVESNFELPGYFSISGKYKDIDHRFESLTFSPNQDRIEKNLSFSWKRFRFLPFTVFYSKNEITTPPENIVRSKEPLAQYLSSWEEGKIIEEKKGVKGSFNIRYLPRISFSYSQSSATYKLKGRSDFSETGSASLSYSFPNLLILPRKINAGANVSRKKVSFHEILNQIDYEERNLSYNMSGPFKFFSILDLTPSYKYSERRLKKFILDNGENDFLPQSKTVDGNVKVNLRLLRWLSPSLNYNVKITENYLIPTSTSTWISEGVKFKDINRTGKGSVSLPLNIGRILPWISPLKTLSLRANLSISDGETYKNVDSKFYSLNKFFLRDKNLKISTLDVPNPEAELHLLSSRKDQKYSLNWSPFSSFNLKGVFLPIKTLKLQSYMTKIDERKEQGTVSINRTVIWPDLKFNINNIEKWLFFTKTASLYSEYKKNLKETVGITRSLSYHRRYDLRCNIKNYQTSISLTRVNSFSYDLRNNIISNKSKSLSLSGVLKFSPFKKWNLSLNLKGNIKRAYNSSLILTEDLNLYSLIVQLFSDFIRWERPIQLPFSKNPLKLAQQVKFNMKFQSDFKRSRLNVITTNYNLYKFDFSMDFNISRNFRWTLGSGLMFQQYLKKRANSFIAFKLRTDLQIIF
ncbi:MAG: hypothetical protein DRI36_03735 [Caldiserica bacterium]|nr:MAG: hypothetical protein DRI36_03735 [Caldisericota bacterium]